MTEQHLSDNGASENGVYRVERVITRVETSRGVVLNIDGISPALWQRLTLHAQKLWPFPAPVTAVYYIDPDDERTRSEDEIMDEEMAEFWQDKDPERNGGLVAKFKRWQRKWMEAQRRQMAFTTSEAIRCGVTVDIEATRANGVPVPDAELTWRDRVPRYPEDPDEIQPGEWEQYLEEFAIATLEDYGIVNTAINTLLHTPTEEGVRRAMDLFRAEMETGYKRPVAATGDAPGAEAEAGETADTPVTVGVDEAGGESVGDEA